MTATSPPRRLTRAQVREIDRLSIERYGIPGIVLMENAAIGAANVAWEMLIESGGSVRPANQAVGAAQRSPGSDGQTAYDVLILCGGGNNGGDGLAVARHLHNRGCHIRIALTVEPGSYKGDALINWHIARSMRLNTSPFAPSEIAQPDLIIDAVFGTGLSKAPRDPFATFAAAVNASGVPVLAIDLPSGLDCDTGHPLGPVCVRATHTVTFVAEKAGFATPNAAPLIGAVTVAGIGCPEELIQEVLTSAASPA